MIYQLNSRAEYLPQVMEIAEPAAMKTWFLEKVKEACRNVLNKREEKSGSIIGRRKIILRITITKTFPWMMYPER